MNAEQKKRLEQIIDGFEQIIVDYGHFLETHHLSIQDASRLPYPKAVILAALTWKESELCDLANKYVRENDQKTSEEVEVEKQLNLFQSVMQLLYYYSTIDPEDQERVDYFNDTYKITDRVPGIELGELFGLRTKYTTRRMRESGIEPIDPASLEDSN